MITDTVQILLGLSAAALPTVTVLVGILLNRNDSTRLDNRISALKVSLRALIAAARAQFHSDILMLLGSDKEQDWHITQLEGRS